MAFTKLEPHSVNTSANFTFANVTATYFSGDGSLLTNVSGSTSYSNSNVAAYLPTYDGNVSANFFIGNGSQLTGLPASYSNVNVAAYLPTYTGNVSAAFYLGNGSQLTSITGTNVSGYVANADHATVANTVTTNAQPNITSVGTLSSLTVGGTSTLGTAGNIKITGGLANYVLTTDGLGNLSWTAGGGGSGGGGGAGFITVSKDTFTATGSANTYTLSITPSSVAYIVVNIDGLVQQLSAYSLAGNVVTISGMPTAGEIIEVTSYGTGGLPGGSDTQVQFNSSGVFQGAPAFTFNSATSTLTVTNIVGNIATASQPNITSVGALSSLSVSGNVSVTGLTSLQQSTEKIVSISGATGTVTHDFSSGATFNHTSPAADFTVNITNVPTTNDRSIVVTLIINQGSTPYIPTAVQIDGSAQSILWPGGTVPTGNASKKDVFGFTLTRISSTWTVFGLATSFG